MKFDANGWLDDAIKIDYTNKSMSREGYQIRDVVIHSTAGGTSAEAIGIFFRDGDREASAHFIIDQVGKIVQGIPLTLAAWGNGILSPGHAPFIPDGINPNSYTVSIEHCKEHDDNSDQLTPIQAQKSFELIKCICDAYGIPKRAGDANGGILAHNQITNTACPGPYPWDELYSYLNGGNKPMPTTPQVPQGWSDDGHTLKAPNGIPVVLGFRDKVLTSSPPWDSANWPMRAEYHADPVEQSHPSLGAGPAQEFRMDRLAACASLGIYKSWPGQELYWYQKQHALLLAQVADLQKQIAALQPTAAAQENVDLKAKISQAVKILS